MSIVASGLRTFGKKTANAGTAYTLLVEPVNIFMPFLNFAQFTVGATAHTLTIMRPLSSQQVSGQANRCSAYLTAAAPAATPGVFTLNQNPGTFTSYFNSTPRTANNGIAANDYVAFQYPDGSWGVDTVASVSTLTVTLTGSIGTGGLAAGAPVWFFGITTDTNPYDAQAHPAYNLFANSAPLNLGATGEPIASTFRVGEPLLLYVNNATNASVLEQAVVEYQALNGPYAQTGAN